MEWSCSNVSIDPTNGMVWVITGNKNKIWAFTASGWREYPGGGTAADVSAKVIFLGKMPGEQDIQNPVNDPNSIWSRAGRYLGKLLK